MPLVLNEAMEESIFFRSASSFSFSTTADQIFTFSRTKPKRATSSPFFHLFNNKSSKMSCNGCRVLRKGCSNTCTLRPCLQWIDSPESQAHATIFVAKFFGRAGMMSFISAVPQSQRPALFQSLLYEACGRTVNPVNGAVGLMASGYWHLCQSAVDTVLKGGKLLPLPDLGQGQSSPDGSEVSFQPAMKRKRTSDQDVMNSTAAADDDDLNLSLRVSCGSSSMEFGMTTNTGSRFGNGAETKLLNLF